MENDYLFNRFLTLTVVILIITVFVIDTLIPLGVAGGVRYVAPVLLSYRFRNIRAIIIVAIVCSILTLLGLFLSPPGNVIWMVITNRLLALFAIGVTALLLVKYKQSESSLRRERKELEVKVNERTDELTKRAKRLQKLSELSMTLAGDPQEIFNNISRMIAELLNVPIVCLSEIRGDELYFLSVYAKGEVSSNAGHSPLNITPCSTVENDKKTVIIDNVAEKFPDAKFLKEHNAYSYCGFPSIDSSGKVIAATSLIDDKPHDFSEEDIDLLNIFGQRIATEIERQKHLLESKKAEDAIREQALIIDQIHDSVISTNLDGVVTSWNKGAERLFGYSADEMMGDHISRVYPEEDHEFLFKKRMVSLKKKGNHEVEVRMRRKSGDVFYAHLFLSMLRDKHGVDTGMIGYSMDITERKRAEDLLRENEMRYRALFEDSPTSLWEEDLSEVKSRIDNLRKEGVEDFRAYFKVYPEEVKRIALLVKIVDINQATLNLYQAKNKEELLSGLDRTFTPESYVTFERELLGLIEGNVDEEYEAITKTLTGEIRNILLKIAVTPGNETCWSSVIISITDITARKKAESELTRLFTAVEHAAETIVITDTEGTIQYVNPAFERTSGYIAEEAIGKNPRILSSGKHDEAFYKEMWETIASGEVWSGRFINKKKNGELYEEEATISPIKDPSGTITGYGGILRDITHEVMLRKQYRQAQKMEALGTLSGGIAHDFNNILTSIMCNADLAMDYMPESSKGKDEINKILSATKRASNLIQRILLFSRGDENLDNKPTFLQPVLKESLELIRSSLPKTIEISQNIDINAGPTLGNPTQINQVIMNLCVNAGYAMKKTGGKLTVSLKEVEIGEDEASAHPNLQVGSYLKVEVRDTGHGMDKEIVERIFEPFFTTKRSGGGSGLGLATVHGIVTGYGGTITVDSEPGKGSIFAIYFPRVDYDIEVKCEAEQDDNLEGAENILLVDDEEYIAEGWSSALRKLGYSVTTFVNPVEALDGFRESPERFDLVITDQTMPDMTGEALGKEILRLRPDMPMILCTGFSNTMGPDKAQAIGFSKFITKPIANRDFAQVVRNVIDINRYEGE